METTLTEHDGRVLTRLDSGDRVFEVSFDAIKPTDVPLRFLRDDVKVGSIYNDDGTDRMMARLTTAPDCTDFISVEVPKPFVVEVLDFAVRTDRVTDETAAEGYRLRVL
jgi:hypothetical protein